jgi:hypothetical protein
LDPEVAADEELMFVRNEETTSKTDDSYDEEDD